MGGDHAAPGCVQYYSVPQCVFLTCWVLIVKSKLSLTFMDVFVKVASLHIQFYSCCFSHVSVSFSSVGARLVLRYMHFYSFSLVVVFFKMFVYWASLVG